MLLLSGAVYVRSPGGRSVKNASVRPDIGLFRKTFGLDFELGTKLTSSRDKAFSLCSPLDVMRLLG